MTATIPVPTGLLTALPSAGSLLDPDRLSRMWGAPARAHYLRYKPGTSLVAAINTESGWAWAVSHVDPDKLDKLWLRAERFDARIVSLGPGAAAGSVPADRVVGKGFRRLARRASSVIGARGPVTSRMLRYNPSRRAVVALEVNGRPVAVGRVGRPGGPLRAELLVELHRAGLAAPVLAADDAAGFIVLSWRPGTVRDRLGPTDREAVAEILERLGAIDPPNADLPRYDQTWWDHSLAEAAAAIASLDPGLGARAAEVIAGLERPEFGRPRLVHGDFSADQIVWDGTVPGLIDYDRAGIGPGWLDPGTVLATECLAAGNSDPATDCSELVRRAAAQAVLRRATEPFRRVDPAWPVAMAGRLDLAAELAA